MQLRSGALFPVVPVLGLAVLGVADLLGREERGRHILQEVALEEGRLVHNDVIFARRMDHWDCEGVRACVHVCTLLYIDVILSDHPSVPELLGGVHTQRCAYWEVCIHTGVYLSFVLLGCDCTPTCMCAWMHGQ